MNPSRLLQVWGASGGDIFEPKKVRVVDWTAHVDGYCERADVSFWAEPVNAVTNLAFLLAMLVMWRRCRGVAHAPALCVLTGLIGLGSFLFHTFAQVWAGLADVLPIVCFILLYLFALNREVLEFSRWRALLVTALFIPFAAATIPLLRHIPILGVSAGYLPVPVFIVMYAALMRHRAPVLARGMLVGAALLCLSLAARSVDLRLCERWPLGTHFAWHVLNGLVLAWMIEVYRRSRLGKPELAR